MGRQRASSALTLGVVAALGAAVLLFSADEQPAADSFVAVGSTSNNGSSSCKGLNNASCATNPSGGGPVKTMTVTVTNPSELLYPTVSRNVTVTVANPFAFDIVVTSLDVQVTAPQNRSTCVASDLQRPTSPMAQNLTVAAGRSGSMTFAVHLIADAPPGCQGAVWPITVTATAVQR